MPPLQQQPSHHQSLQSINQLINQPTPLYSPTSESSLVRSKNIITILSLTLNTITMHGLISTLATMLPLAAAAPFGLASRDANAGCQAASFGNFSWTVEDFDFHASYIFTTPAHQVGPAITSSFVTIN